MSDHGGKRDPQGPTNTLYWIVGSVLALLGLALFLFAIANTPAIELIGTMPKSVGTIFNKLGVEGLSWPWSGGCAHVPWMSKDEAAAYCHGKEGFVIPLPGQQGAVGVVGGGSAQVSLDTAVRQFQFGSWDGANGSCSLAETAYSQALSEGNAAVQSQAELLIRECSAALSALQGMQACNPITDQLTCIMHAEEVLKRNPANRQAADVRELAFRAQEWESLRQQASQLSYEGEQDNWSTLWPPIRRQQVIDLLWGRRFSIVGGVDIGIFRSAADDVRVALTDVPSYVPIGATEPQAASPIEFRVPLGVMAELMGQNPDRMDPDIYQGWDRTHQLSSIPGGYIQPAGPQQIPSPPAPVTLDLNPQPPAVPVQSAPVGSASTSCIPGTIVPGDWPVFMFDPVTGFPTEVTGSISAINSVLTGGFVGEGTKILCKTNVDGVHVWPGPLYGWTR